MEDLFVKDVVHMLMFGGMILKIAENVSMMFGRLRLYTRRTSSNESERKKEEKRKEKNIDATVEGSTSVLFSHSKRAQFSTLEDQDFHIH